MTDNELNEMMEFLDECSTIKELEDYSACPDWFKECPEAMNVDVTKYYIRAWLNYSILRNHLDTAAKVRQAYYSIDDFPWSESDFSD